MIYFFYNILLIFFIILFAPLIGLVLLLRKKYRCGFFQKCGLMPKEMRAVLSDKNPIWIHAVSVGEVMATAPLIREIKKTYPDIPILLSTVTETGNFTARHNTRGADHVIYFPFDLNFIVAKMIRTVHPVLFVTLETELWPNFSRCLRLNHIPSMVVSGRISSESFKSYRFFRFFFKKVLTNIDCFCMQTRTDAERIISIGAAPEKVTVAGNIKFDLQIPAITDDEKKDLYKNLHISNRQTIFIAGSTHRGEEEIIIRVFSQLRGKKANLVLLLAPRHPERFDETADLLKKSGLPFVRKTDLAASPAIADKSVILLDTIGELAKSYSIADIVFIGGSMVPVGGHNVLEPAVFSKPVIYGPYMDNFREMSKLLQEKKAAIQVRDTGEFIRQARALLADRALRQKIGETAFAVIRENSGAVDKSMEALIKLMGNNQKFKDQSSNDK